MAGQSIVLLHHVLQCTRTCLVSCFSWYSLFSSVHTNHRPITATSPLGTPISSPREAAGRSLSQLLPGCLSFIVLCTDRLGFDRDHPGSSTRSVIYSLTAFIATSGFPATITQHIQSNPTPVSKFIYTNPPKTASPTPNPAPSPISSLDAASSAVADAAAPSLVDEASVSDDVAVAVFAAVRVVLDESWPAALQ